MFFGQLQHEVEHAVGGAAVQVAGGLVGQHAIGPRHQRTGHRHTLTLSARQLRRPVVQALLQTHGLEHVGCGQRGLTPVLPAYPQRHGHVVQRAELGQQMVKLVDKAQMLVAHAALRCGRQARHVLPEQSHLAAAGQVQPAHQVQQRAFA